MFMDEDAGPLRRWRFLRKQVRAAAGESYKALSEGWSGGLTPPQRDPPPNLLPHPVLAGRLQTPLLELVSTLS